MSIKTEYICDKCGAVQSTKEQFWELKVSSEHVDYTSRNIYVDDAHTMQVCRPCLEYFGFHVQVKPGQSTPTAPTLEELIVEIVNNAIGDANR